LWLCLKYHVNLFFYLWICIVYMKQSSRIFSLDVFRGLTIALMIIVNSPGTAFPYPFLDHSPWNGCTLADLVFPFFLFIVGMTSVISLKRYKEEGAELLANPYPAIFKRTVVIFLLGLLLNIFPNHFDISQLRFFGVLQRVAVCYFLSAVIYLHCSNRMQFFIFCFLLGGYWLLMTQIPVPGFGANQITAEGSWVAYFDQMVFSSAHLYEKVFDPEGLLSTLPSLATTLSGCLTGSLLLSTLNLPKKLAYLVAIGLVFLLLGWLWSYSFPINKNLWTSSYVLWTSGIALLVFAGCFLMSDIWAYRAWAMPLKIFGVNALFAYMFHVLLLKTQAKITFPMNGGTMGNFKIGLTQYLFGGFNPQNAALLYALGFLLLNFLVVYYLYRREIFIKI